MDMIGHHNAKDAQVTEIWMDCKPIGILNTVAPYEATRSAWK